MFKILVISAGGSEKHVVHSVIEFDTKTDANIAITNINDSNSYISFITTRAIPLYR